MGYKTPQLFMILRAIKIRLYQNKTQEQTLNKVNEI